MDLTASQIEAARAAGIIPDVQADALLARLARLAPASIPSKATVTPETQPLMGDEENLRFFRSFSDIFITIGVILVMFAASISIGKLGFGEGNPWGALITAAIFYAMSEYFGRVRRANLPTLVLSIGYALSLMTALSAMFGEGLLDMQIGNGGLSGKAVLSAALFLAGVALYYWRIRLPFCFVILAWGIIAFIMTVLLSLGLYQHPRLIPPVWTALGIATVSVALLYDIRDPDRIRRYSDNAFWLHSVASPVLVSGLVACGIALVAPQVQTLEDIELLGKTFENYTPWIFLVVGVSILFGLAINRRVFVISTLIYAVGTMVFLVSRFDLFDGQTTFAIGLAIVGSMVIFLGVGWHPARRALLKLLPRWPIFPRSQRLDL